MTVVLLITTQSKKITTTIYIVTVLLCFFECLIQFKSDKNIRCYTLKTRLIYFLRLQRSSLRVVVHCVIK